MKRLSVGYFLIGLLIVGVIGKPTLDDPTGEGEESMQADEEDYASYDDEDISSQDKSVQEESVSVPVLLSKDYKLRKDVGEDALLTCEVESSGKKLPVILWYNGTAMITQGQIRTSKDDRLSLDGTNLLIRNVQIADANLYRCVILPTKLSLNVTLEVGNTGKTQILHRGRDVTEQTITFKHGDRIELQCTASANPTPTIKWFTGGKRGSEVAGITIDSNDGSLIIENPDHTHNLLLQCLADNGEASHATVQLVIQHKPIVTNHRRFFNTDLGANGNLFCVYKTQGEGTFQWHFNGVALKNDTKYLQTTNTFNNKNHMHLLVKNVIASDIGQYTCEVKNSQGKDAKEVHLILMPEPGHLNNVEVNNKETRLEWLVHCSVALSEVALSYQAVGTNKWSSEKPTIVERQIKDPSSASEHSGVWRIEHHLQLSPGKWHARMKTRNSYGWSKFSAQETIEVPETLEEDFDLQFADLTGGKTNAGSSIQAALALPIVLLVSAALAAIQRT